MIERLVILTEGNTVRYADLRSDMLAEPEPTVDQGQGKAVKSRTLTVPRKKLSLRDMERQEIEAALRRRAQAECLEEVGLNLPLDAFEELGPPSFPSPGITDEKVYFLAAQVDFTQAVPPKGDGSVMEEVGGLVLLDLQDFLESPSPTDMKTDLALRRLAARL